MSVAADKLGATVMDGGTASVGYGMVRRLRLELGLILGLGLSGRSGATAPD